MKNKQTLLLLMPLILLATTTAVTAQRKLEAWAEWSKKDAEKILNDSPWGQTQTETDISEINFKPTTEVGGGTSADRTERGALNQATSVKYRIRFLSAKPVRQAIARTILLDNPAQVEKLGPAMREFIERNFEKWIVVTVVVESSDQRFSNRARQAFAGAVTASLKNQTYLERKDGKRMFLQIYQGPGADGLGAKFIFPRSVDGQPFLDTASGEVRFFSEVSKNITLNMRFKLSAMTYAGRLEY